MKIRGFEFYKKIPKNTKFIKAKNLKKGQKIEVLAYRRNYETDKNIHHGYFKVPGIIKIEDTGERLVCLSDKIRELISARFEQEAYDQIFPFFWDLNRRIVNLLNNN